MLFQQLGSLKTTKSGWNYDLVGIVILTLWVNKYPPTVIQEMIVLTNVLYCIVVK